MKKLVKDFKKNISLFPAYFTVFLDALGFGLIIPIITPLFLGIDSPFFKSGGSEYLRNVTLGFLIASYGLAQFFGAPILGALSDRYGRKKLLTFSILFTAIPFFIFALGIVLESITLLILSRIIDGFTGGNISIILSSIADVSEKKDKVRKFALLGVSSGLGLIIGPAIGGILSNRSLIPWFNYITPFIFAGFLSLLNVLLIQLFFKETNFLKTKSEVSFKSGFKNLKKAFKSDNLKILFLVSFLLVFGFNFFLQFFQFFLIKKLQFDSLNIGLFLGYVGIWVAFTQALLIRPVNKLFPSGSILKFSIVGLSAALFSTVIIKNLVHLFLISPLIAIFDGLTTPTINSMVSNSVDEKSQGEILGINQSIQSLAISIPSIIGGFAVSFNIFLPTIIGSSFILLAWMIYVSFYKETNIS